MTTMTFALGGTLPTELEDPGNGVYLYAFAFGNPDPKDKDSTIVELPPLTMISNGTLKSSLSIDLNQLGDFASGNVVVVLQQTGPGGTSNLISEVQNNGIGYLLDPANATYSASNPAGTNFRYDAIEATLTGAGTDAGDLTNIVQFGGPMELSITYSNRDTQTRGYGVNGNTLASQVIDLSPPKSQNYDWSTLVPGGPLIGQRELLGLANNVTPNPLTVPSYWSSYVTGFETLVSGGSSSPVYIANYFSGSALGPPSLCYFQVQYDAETNAGQGGTFWLVPVDLDGVTITQAPYEIAITADELESNIVAQTGTLSVYNPLTGGLVQTYSSFTPNNAYGDVAKYFVAGFDAGFWGGAANSINPTDSGSNYSLNQTWNWSAPYAYEVNGTLGYGYTNSIGTGASTSSGFYDQFAQYFFQNTNAYGYSYSDLISNGGGVNPQISLWDNGTSSNVSNINVTLYNYSDAPAGYTAPRLNYVSDAVTNAAANKDQLASNLHFVFDLSLNGGAAAPVDGTPITFRVYAPKDHSAVDGFVDFTVSAARSSSPYEYYYQLDGSPGHWKPLRATNPGGQNGFFAIYGIPVIKPNASNWNWYQLVIGTAGSPGYKAYNLYVQTDGTTVFNAMADGAAVVDTSVAGEAKFAMVSGGNVTYDPQWWNTSTPVTAVPQDLPSPLVGNIADDDSFIPFLDVSQVDHGEMAFSWSPAQSGANKVVGGYYVKLNLANRDHSDWIMMPLVTQSPLDGGWLTTLSAQFGNGDYSAFMSQYKLKDPSLTRPVVASSVPVDFTVKLDNLPLVAADGGTALGFGATGSTTDGNWIELQALRSTLPNGTLIAYATDANGNLVDRGDGHAGSDVTFQDSVLGRFGVANDDHGGLMSVGDDAIYLKAGEELHFALETGNGTLQQSPAVQIAGSGALNVTVGSADGLLQFAAAVNNDLSANDALAAAQRTTDQPWVYLTQGATVQVEAEGSAFCANTVHFVRIDVDPNSSAWSVGGVAYGNTDAFRAAVQQNWDQGLALTDGHGTFHDDESWTVAGQSGFYAPVLATQAGDIFVNGNANVDGRDHIRSFGGTTFGFEDTPASRGSDFDFNDMVVKLTVNPGH
jgi:hypothetical protein